MPNRWKPLAKKVEVLRRFRTPARAVRLAAHHQLYDKWITPCDIRLALPVTTCLESSRPRMRSMLFALDRWPLQAGVKLGSSTLTLWSEANSSTRALNRWCRASSCNVTFSGEIFSEGVLPCLPDEPRKRHPPTSQQGLSQPPRLRP